MRRYLADSGEDKRNPKVYQGEREYHVPEFSHITPPRSQVAPVQTRVGALVTDAQLACITAFVAAMFVPDATCESIAITRNGAFATVWLIDILPKNEAAPLAPATISVPSYSQWNPAPAGMLPESELVPQLLPNANSWKLRLTAVVATCVPWPPAFSRYQVAVFASLAGIGNAACMAFIEVVLFVLPP